ncbi:adenosylcobinamide amidohydrolase [Starkeya sp. ORNL1]|uniref:adenosylcobinamide amidohydrolase n=1 Tax=Starkeya sp. ORNL1 TaxID=2709380 RepID=UPI0014636E2F|nr:adenosylcobinamide amidohydrolase [Starkeya sp. ORNL1]QJP15881.1 adenosylcobinamide amidohydrolase [Starkeya sp. ORNL1]
MNHVFPLPSHDTGATFAVQCAPPWLTVRFRAPQRAVSWSLNRPGLVDATDVAWLQVRDADLPADREPAEWFAEKLASVGLADAVGMMTARDIASFVHRAVLVEAVEAHCVVTLGLNNGERVGSRIAQPRRYQPGTVNILCHVSQPLTDAALLEAASLAAQARTVAIVEADYHRVGQSLTVTGTGTDCIVMAAPLGPEPAAFAGMHTAVGEAVGACVLEATTAALTAWIDAR